MKRTVLVFGFLSGAITAAMLAVMMPLCMSGTIDFDHAEVLGYASMFLSFLLVFFGIRSYRENVAGGSITFSKAFQVGILITLVSCAVYVVSWEIYYFGFNSDFGAEYAAFTLEKLRESGASEARLAAEKAKMEDFVEMYKNPLINAGITFMEVFPVGLIMTLVSAAILRRRTGPPEAAAALG